MTLTRGWTAAGVAMGTIVLLLAACGGGDSSSNEGATPSGDAFDKAFIDAMVPHHQSAIEMATAAMEAGLSQPDLVEVANDILATQQLEINQMKDWRGRMVRLEHYQSEGRGRARPERRADGHAARR